MNDSLQCSDISELVDQYMVTRAASMGIKTIDVGEGEHVPIGGAYVPTFSTMDLGSVNSEIKN
eukprot:3386606-Amphidinium_carterae.1